MYQIVLAKNTTKRKKDNIENNQSGRGYDPVAPFMYSKDNTVGEEKFTTRPGALEYNNEFNN